MQKLTAEALANYYHGLTDEIETSRGIIEGLEAHLEELRTTLTKAISEHEAIETDLRAAGMEDLLVARKNTHSEDGREWARLSELKTGDMVVTDGSFPCMENCLKEVFIDKFGDFYVHCDDGAHVLYPNAKDGDGCDGDHIVGVWKASSNLNS